MISEYTVKEALAELNISKATLYYRINKFKGKMQPHILMKNRKKLISREGIEVLRVNDDLGSLTESSGSLDNCSDNSDDCSNYSESKKKINNDAFNILKLENEFLKSQIIEKDNQIQTLSRLVENSQLLLKHEQDKSTLMIDGKKQKKDFGEYLQNNKQYLKLRIKTRKIFINLHRYLKIIGANESLAFTKFGHIKKHEIGSYGQKQPKMGWATLKMVTKLL